MKYDIKIYDKKGEERETIRDLKYCQREAILPVLVRHNIKFEVFEIFEEEEEK